MSNESDPGAAYLAALRQSTASPSACAGPARPPEAPPFADALPANQITSGRTGPVAEKRRSPRYRCQGSAQLRKVNSGVATWATVSDISLHGCYVEAAAGFAVGTVLTLAIELNGFRVQVAGTVRVAYPGLGMGVSFTRIADEDRERLRDLVRSLSKPSVIMGARPLEPRPSAPSTNRVVAGGNASAALEAITEFFEDRHVMGREEFLRILRKTQPPGHV